MVTKGSGQMEGRRNRRKGHKPPPEPVAAEREEPGAAATPATAARRRRTTRGSVSNEKARNPASGRRLRTPRPSTTQALEDARPAGPGAGILAERMQQLRHLQDFYHNPVPFDLRDRPIESSSTPDEIVRRIGEVQYQIDVLKAILVVLNEEIEA